MSNMDVPIHDPRIDLSQPIAESVDNQEWWTSKVVMNGKEMLFSISACQAQNSKEAEVLMRASLDNVAALAKGLQLGEGGLQAITITEKNVMGHWQQKGTEVKEDFIEKLSKEKDTLNLDSQERAFRALQSKIDLIQKKIPQLAAKHLHLSASLRPLPLGADNASSVPSSSSHSVSSSSSSSVAAPKSADYREINQTEFIEKMSGEFHRAHAAADMSHSSMEGAEEEKQTKLLNQLGNVYAQLDALEKQEGLSKDEKMQALSVLKLEMLDTSFALKNRCNQFQNEAFQALESGLVKMTQAYNTVVERREGLQQEKSVLLQTNPDDASKLQELDANMQQLQQMQREMGEVIRRVNTFMEQKSLTTHAWTAAKSDVMNFAAVVERKIDLMKKIEESKNPITRFKCHRQLAAAPTKEKMAEVQAAIQADLGKDAAWVLDTKAIKSRHELHIPDLKWGKSYLKIALTTAANWTNIYKAFMKESSSGRLYVHVTKNEPVGIGLEGGVPAGLRAHKDYKTMATNLIKTTSYMRSSQAEAPQGHVVGFRGGQFPTMEAAKEALTQILADKPTELHINSLLTPSLLTWASADKKLLIAHRKNILLALQSLKQTSPDDRVFLEKLEKQLAVSNFGVNDWAMGDKKVLRIRLSAFRPGWHYSVFNYTNDATQQLNASLNRKFARMTEGVAKDSIETEDLDRLGALVQVGQEMEEVWATNSYADAKVGNNQFKMPALWSVMDSLLGVRQYKNCMSGKDRTSKVEENAREYHDEMNMSIADHKRVLKNTFTELTDKIPIGRREEWLAQEKYLTAACFNKQELTKAFAMFMDSGATPIFADFVKAEVQKKIELARQSLGVAEGGKFLELKTKSIGPTQIRSGVSGISKNTPKRNQVHANPLDTGAFSQFSISSMFNREPINWGELKNISGTQIQNFQDMLTNRQREAQNSRLSQLSGSLEITAINTSKPGFKVKGSEAFSRFSSGFDRDYVLFQLLTAPVIDQDSFNRSLGLQEIDIASGQKFFEQAVAIGAKYQTLDERIEKWTALLKKIEKEKTKSLSPQAKVKS